MRNIFSKTILIIFAECVRKILNQFSISWVPVTYFDRHNNICRYIHFKILKHYNMDVGENWYMHKPAEVIIKPSCEIVYNQVVSTTRPIGANRPDIIVKDMNNSLL